MAEFTLEDAVQRYVQNVLDLYSRLDEDRRGTWAVKSAIDKAEEVLRRASTRFAAEPIGDVAVARDAWNVLAQALIDQIKGRVAD